MDKQLFVNRVIMAGLGIAVLFSFSRNSSLAVRLQIMESSLARANAKLSAPQMTQSDDAKTLRQLCTAFRGRVSGSGQRLYCDLPRAASEPILAARIPASGPPSPTGRTSGGGIEVHYPDWNRRECIETTGAAKCDPMSKAVTCPNGVRLVRVAFSQNGKGIRNRYVCN